MEENLNFSRRTFLNYVGASTLLSLVPDPVKGNAYANSEKLISDEWLALARKYGEPTGKFGKIGDPVTLTIGYQPYGSLSVISSINRQAQILEKYLPRGSKVVWRKALSGAGITKNLESGKDQFGYMAESPAITAGDKIACDCISANGYDIGEFGSLCISKKYLDNGEIKDPKDLEGKKIATAAGSFTYRFLLTLMKEYNIKLTIETQTIDQQLLNLSTGKIHGAAFWEPYTSWLEYKNIAQRWLTGKDIPNTTKFYFPDSKTKHFQVIGASLALHDWLKERPDIIRAYLKSEEECRDMFVNDIDLAAYFLWTEIRDIPAPVVRSMINIIVRDGRINEEAKKHLKACAKMWKEEGFLKNPRSENPEKYIDDWADDRMLQLAMKELEADGFWTSNQLPGFPNPMFPEQLQRHDPKKYENIHLTVKPWKQTKI